MQSGSSCHGNWSLANDYADGRLKGRRRRSAEAHLTQCAHCRETVEEVRRLRRLVAETPVPPPSTGFWERCMQTIAVRAQSPRGSLWRGRWPTVRLVLAGALVALLAWSLLGRRPGGLVERTQPSEQLAALQSQYLAQHVAFVLGQPLNLTSHYVLLKALSEADSDAESSGEAAGMSVAPTQVATASAASGQRSLSAAAWLVRAITAPRRVSYSAWQQIVIRGPEGEITQRVRVVHRVPDDNRWEYFAGPGQVERVVVDDGQLAWQHLPRQHRVIYAPCLRADPNLRGDQYIERLAENYSITAAGRERIAGLPAVLLVIAPRDGHCGPTQWLWVDEHSGLVLRSQTRSADGHITVTSALSDVRFPQTLPDREFSPPMRVTRQSVLLAQAVALPLEALAREWGHALLTPGAMPAGYSLESARFVRQGRQSFVHLCYSDGLNTISLFETAALPTGASGGAAQGDQVHGSPAIWGGRGSFRALSWQEQGLSLMLVGDLPSDEMLRLARGVHRAP